MALHVALCRHLDHAEQHSAELVRRLRPSPLHRINILVGSGVASRYTQRRLATPPATHLTDQLADQPDTERRALANVSLFTPFDLARQIAARGPSAANPPLPDGADVALLQRVLYELAPQGRLEQFRPDQPGLPAALARTFGDLRDADIDADELAAWALARPQPARDLALVYERWRALLATLNFSDRPAVYQAALDAPPHIWRETLGAAPLIVTGIYDLTRLQRLLIRQAARVTEVHFVALAPDDQDFAYARRAVRRLCRETGTTASEAPDASPALDLVPEAFSAPDPQAEAEEIARRILDLARSGVRFHNIAIFHRQGPAADQRLAAALQRAEIPVYRARGLSLRRTAAGRATRQLLRLLWDTPTRSTLLELLGNPAIKREIDAKPILWERISRSAGLVSEWDRMSTQLRTYIEKDDLFDHERRLTGELLDRIKVLSERAEQAREADTWAAAAQQLIAALNEWIETPSAADALAAGVIRSAIGNLGRLDELEITFTDDDFRRAAERALEKAVSRDAGPLSAGVYIGDANGAGRSVRFDAIFIAGLVERTMPAVPRQDPLLSDPQRRDLNEFLEAEVLRLQNERAETDRLAFQLICQAAREHLTLSWARRSSTVGAPSRPSPLLLSAVGGLAGLLDGPDKLVADGRIDHLPATVSGAAGPRRRRAQVVETTQDAQEAEDVARDVGAPLRAIDEADLHLALLTTPGVEAHRLLPALWAGAERALAARLRRNAQTFTEYDGVISLGDEQVAPEHWSASALQRYATCPYRYFLGNVLRLNAVSEPGDDAEISPLERGSLIHRILERWVRGWIEQPDHKPWHNFVADPTPCTPSPMKSSSRPSGTRPSACRPPPRRRARRCSATWSATAGCRLPMRPSAGRRWPSSASSAASRCRSARATASARADASTGSTPTPAAACGPSTTRPASVARAIWWATTTAPRCSCRSTCMPWAALPSDERTWPTPPRRCITSPTAGISRSTRSRAPTSSAAPPRAPTPPPRPTSSPARSARSMTACARAASSPSPATIARPATTAPTATSAPPAAPMSTSGSPTRSASISTPSSRSS